jgi:hypothetical protein
MGQLALGVAGAVVGSFFGAPEVGFMLGSLAGGLLFPPRGKGPQINDLRVQQSAYGQPIPRIYGTYRVAGNMIWAGTPVESDSSGKGKGPGMPKVTMSFAMGICKGPMQAIRRIWANGKLVYDYSNPSNFENLSGSSSMLTNFTFYPGDESQQPDPTMQAALGAANVPAYRGLCYVVFNELDLSSWGNYIPSFTFEVMSSATTVQYNGILSSWSPEPGQNMIWSFNNFNKNGGVPLAYTPYPGVFDGLWTGNVTPYGSSYGFVWNNPATNNPGDFGMGGGFSADQPTILAQAGWWDSNGVKHTSSDWTSLPWPTNINFFSYYMGGGDFFFTSSYGGSAYHTYRLETLTNTLQATSVLTGPGAIVGVTTGYVYVAYGSIVSGTATANTLYQLDRHSLAVVNSWTVPTGFGIGYAIDDGDVYMLDGSGVIWHFNAYGGTFTNTGGVCPFGNHPLSMMAVNNGLFMFTGPGAITTTIQLGYTAIGTTQVGGVPLSSIVAAELQLAGMSNTQYDVSQLTDLVAGYCVTSHGSPRDAITPLMQAYFFDVADSGGLLKFVKRGSQPIGTIQWSDLGAALEHADPNPITETIVQEIDLPRTLTFKYINIQTDYQESSQRAFMDTSASNLDLAVQAAVVMSDDDAIQKAQCMLWSAWAGRFQLDFSLGLGYLKYEPGDVVYLQDGSGNLHTARIASCEYDGSSVLKFKALGEYPGLYSSTAAGGAAAGFTPQQIGYSGPTLLVVLDVPPLRNTDTTPGLYVAACGYAANWPGCAVYQSPDGNAYTQMANITLAGSIGTASTALGSFQGGNRVDELNTLTVTMANGTLSSCTYAQLLSGVNAAWIGGEIVFFRTATLVSGNTYTLSGLLRGRSGTEGFIATHSLGEQFVLLNQSLLEMFSIPQSEIGTTQYYETFLLNQFYTQTPQKQPLAIKNGRVKPFKPHLFSAGHGSASSASDISLKWLRRARVNYSWLDGTDVPLDESSETYTLSIYNGSTLVRSVAVSGPFTSPTVPNYVYTAAQISADGFTTGNTITFTVYQNSDQGVAGDAATTTITR